jgi:hypothetical protein
VPGDGDWIALCDSILRWPSPYTSWYPATTSSSFIYFLAGHKLIGLLKPTIKRWYGFLNFCDETHYDFMAQRGLYGLSLLPRSYY